MENENGGKAKSLPDIEGQPRNRSVKFPTAQDGMAYDELMECIANEPGFQDSSGKPLTKGQAAQRLVALAQKQFDMEGYGSGRAVYGSRFYMHFEAQLNNVLRGLKNALENCDIGIEAIQKECSDHVHEIRETLDGERKVSKLATDEMAEKIEQFKKTIEGLTEEKASLIKENEALVGMKDANNKAVKALEKERETLNERLSRLQDVGEENAKLLKQHRDFTDQITGLKDQITDIIHSQAVALKERELEFQRELAKAIKAAKADERVHAEAEIARLQGVVEQAQAMTNQAEARVDHAQARLDKAQARADAEITRMQGIIEQAQTLAIVAAQKNENHKTKRRPTKKQ